MKLHICLARDRGSNNYYGYFYFFIFFTKQNEFYYDYIEIKTLLGYFIEIKLQTFRDKTNLILNCNSPEKKTFNLCTSTFVCKKNIIISIIFV